MKEPVLYKVVRPLLSGWFKLFFRPQYEGTENIPEQGRIILAGNHTNFFDCFLVGTSTDRFVHFLAKAELMKGIGKHIFTGLGIIPVDRSSASSGAHAVNICKKHLDDNKLIAIFPEGTINRTDDIMMPFKGGAVKIALDSSTKIIPFAITGKYTMFKNNIKIKFMPAMEIERGGLKAANQRLYQTVRQELEKHAEGVKAV